MLCAIDLIKQRDDLLAVCEGFANTAAVIMAAQALEGMGGRENGTALVLRRLVEQAKAAIAKCQPSKTSQAPIKSGTSR